jgi:hypothetical protein
LLPQAILGKTSCICAAQGVESGNLDNTICYILEIKGVVMVGLSNQEVQALGRAVGLDIQEPELSQVAHSLNAILELMEEIDAPGVNAVEPLPIILPQGEV